MQKRIKRKLQLESLEQRYALATGTISGGNLTIADTAATNLLLQQTAANEWTVSNNGTPLVGSPFAGVTGNLTVRTGSGADTIDIDLGGLTAPKSLIVRDSGGLNTIGIHDGGIAATLDLMTGSGGDQLTIDHLQVAGISSLNVGHGANTIDISDSSFARRSTIITGNGTDQVTLGDGLAAVTFGSSLQIRDYGAPDDTLQISDLVTVTDWLLIDNFNTVAIDASAQLHSHLYYSGGFNVPNALTVDASIDGSVWLYGNGAVDTVSFSGTSTVGGSVQAYLRGGNDVANFNGAIGRSLYIDGSSGDDTINLGGTVNTSAKVFLGNGADTFNFTGAIGVAPSTSSSLVIDAGNGADQVAIRAGSKVNGQLSVNMGANDDAFFLADLANVTSASINGGSGSDTYYGTRPRANVVDKFFELFGLVPPF